MFLSNLGRFLKAKFTLTLGGKWGALVLPHISHCNSRLQKSQAWGLLCSALGRL